MRETLAFGGCVGEMMSGEWASIGRGLETVAGKIRRAQRTIELEIQGNNGVYPFNGGQLTEAEVCRRADVMLATLDEPAHATTTRRELGAWLRQVTAPAASASQRSGEDGGMSAAEWKAQLEQIVIAYHRANLEVAKLRGRVMELEEREKALEKKHASLDMRFRRPKGRSPPG